MRSRLATTVVALAFCVGIGPSAEAGPTHAASGLGSTGLLAATVSQVTIDLSAVRLEWPEKVALKGKVTNDDNSPAADVTVQLWAKAASTSDYRVSLFQTNENGWVFATRRPETRVSYQWKMPDPTVRSAEMVVRVAPAVTASASKSRVPRGTRFVISGASSPTRYHAPVKLQRKTASGWQTVDTKRFNTETATLTPSSKYKFPVIARGLGRKEFRVVVAADAGRLRGISSTLYVRYVSG